VEEVVVVGEAAVDDLVLVDDEPGVVLVNLDCVVDNVEEDFVDEVEEVFVEEVEEVLEEEVVDVVVELALAELELCRHWL